MKCLDPDTENAVRHFLARIPADIRLDRAILFGSRARGEHRPDSDADVALILHERGDDGLTLMMLAELAYYSYLDTGIMVQPVTIAIEDWLNPAAYPRPGFLRNVDRRPTLLRRPNFSCRRSNEYSVFRSPPRRRNTRGLRRRTMIRIRNRAHYRKSPERL